MKEYSISNELIDQLKMQFKDYTTCSLDDFALHRYYNKRIAINRDLAPVPRLLHFLLVSILGFNSVPREDKTHWIVPFRYRGTLCALVMEKFGLSLYTEKEDKLNQKQYAREIVGKLQKGVIKVEKMILKPFADYQMQSWNVTIPNYYYTLRRRYDYFRECARKAFKEATIKAPPQKNIIKAGEELNRKNRLEWEGFFNATAMIDGYFSLLENILVFCLPFADKKEEINPSSFILSNWTEKYKKVLSVKSGKRDKEFYDKLKLLKERIRNTYAHGGFDKEFAGSLYIHLPGIGAVPASMSRIKDSLHFHFIPVSDHSFESICKLFDDFDSWMETKRMPNAIKYAKSGIDLPMNDDYLNDMLKAHRNGIFDNWLERMSIAVIDYENVDY